MVRRRRGSGALPFEPALRRGAGVCSRGCCGAEHARMSIFRRQPDPNAVFIIGVPHTPFSDLYHLLLRLPWWVDLLSVSAVFLLMNLLFAGGYMLVGGVSGARPGSLVDHFFF